MTLIKFLLNGKKIDLTGDAITIQSENFSVDETGKLKATAGEIGGFNMTADELSSDIYSEYDFTEEDLTKIQNYIMETGSLTNEEIALYDVYKDGNVDIRDYVMIGNYIQTGISKSTPGKVNFSNGDVFNTFTIKDGLGENLVNLNAFESYIKKLETENLYVNGIDMSPENNVLWSGAIFMNESQEAQLGDLISNQKNGIVLAWSGYENESAMDARWNYTFIPKSHVKLAEGQGVGCVLSSVGFNQIANKYVYVYDDKITGYSANGSSGTTNGITWKNNAYVLRYVIGV